MHKEDLFDVFVNDISWGGSRGGSGGSVEPPKLNVKTYNKRVNKKKVKVEVTLEQLNPFKLPLKTLETAFQRP